MSGAFKKLLIVCTLLLSASFALAQPTFSIINVKNACAGLNNGSFDVKILTANGPVSLLIFGPPNFNRITAAGTTETFTGLKPQNYIIIAQDADGNTIQFQSITDVTPNITFSSAPVKVNNTDCITPNGSITISPVGGSGTYSYSWTGPGAFTATTQNLSGLAAGSYVVTVSDANANCSLVSSAIVVTDPLPNAFTISSPATTLCFGDVLTVNLSAGQNGVTYRIFVDGSSTATTITGPTSTINHAGLAVGAHTVRVQASIGICTSIFSTNTLNIQVNSPASNATLSGTASVCLGTSTNLSVGITGGVGPFSVTINNGVGTINNYVSGTPIPVTPLVTTTYSLTVVTDANGCAPPTLAGSAVVTVKPAPTSAVLSGTASMCAGSGPVNLKVTIAGGTSPYKVTINNGVGTINNYVSGTNIPVSPAANTTYSIVGAVTDAGGCSVAGSGTATITVNTPPTNATISGTATICSGTSTNLSVTITGGLGPYTVTINNGVGTLNNYVSGTPIPVSPVASTTYSLTTVTDANTCAAQALAGSAVVTVKPSPTSAVLSGTATICAGTGPTNLKVTITGGTSPYTVTINNGVGTINNYVSGTNIPVNPIATTVYAITGNVTDAGGCSVAGSGGATVTVNTPPSNATISGTTSICSGTSTNLSVTITGGLGPYTVTINNGVGTLNNYVSGTPIPVSPVASTTYSLTTVTDANTCAAQALAGSAVVTVKPSPTSAVLSGTATICAGTGPTNLKVTITGGTSPYTVTINNGVGTINNYVSGTNIPVNPIATTVYAITGNVTDAGGCSVAGSGGATVTVNTPPSNATISGTTSICSGTSTNLSVTITGGLGPYTVTINNGVGTLNNYVSGTPIPVSPVASTTYSLTTVTDANTCAAQALAGSAVVTVKPSPTSAVLSGTATICAGTGPTNLKVTITGGTSPYTVTINNGVGTINNYVSGTNIPVNPIATTVYAITGNVTDAGGCSVAGSGGATVTVNTPPSNATISGTTSICSGTSTNLSVTITGGLGPYTVTINNGVGTLNNYVSGTPIPVSPVASTTYSLTTVTDANTCAAQALAGSAVVTVKPSPTSAVLSGTTTICGGSGPTNLKVTITGGTSPYTVTINNGVGTINNYVSGTLIPVNPAVTTTYSITGNVSDAGGCSVAGSGSAVVTINTVTGNPATAGVDTWLAYVYDDSGDPAAYPGKANFNISKYRGFFDETDIAAMSPFSSYTPATDVFDVNITNNASGLTIHGPNVCGSYNDVFSIRYRMKKNFAQGIYTFTVGSDDGVRLFLDGVNIIPGGAFVNQSYTTYTSPSQCITAGQHDFVIEYFENAGFSRLTFAYQLASPPTAATPVAACVNSAAPGLTASSPDPGVTGFKWYKDAGLTTLLFAGASFTPAPADLDMTVVGSKSFFVTAVYACGETAAAQVDVNVISSSTITPPATPTQICQSAGIVNLTTLVSAVPTGGSFTFSGTGVTVSPGFDPTLVAGTTSITANYTAGTCTTSISFNIDVISTATITVPAAPVPVCQASTPVDMTTLVSATPLGGSFVFTGAGVTGNNFDPSAQSGAVPITVNYNAAGCTDTKTLNFNVTPTATLTITNPTVCPSGTIDLTGFVTAVPPGGVFTFVGGSNFDPTPFAGSVANVGVSYVQGGCTAVGSVAITVRAVSDPLCGGVTNCSVFTVGISNTRPSCSNQNDGTISINVSGGTPNYSVTLSDGGAFSQTQLGPGAFNFSTLSPANYQITISDASNTCILPYSLPVQGAVQATATNFIDANCFDQPVGGATITVTSGGAAPFEYSLDNGTNWISFTSPVNINNLMPDPAPYSILVRDGPADLCPAQVMVTIGNAVTDIVAPFTVNPATCANNDGSIVTGTISGGVGPYTYSLDGAPFATLPAGGIFGGLASGGHAFTVIDANSCHKDFPFNVGFPGLVNFSTVAINPDCAGNGTNGQLVVTIISTGTFQVGITTDPLVPPATFQNVVSAGSGTANFLNLGKGTYYISAQDIAAACPTILPATIGAGADAVDFQLTPSNALCFENKGGVVLQDIKGSAGTDYAYQIIKSGIVADQGVITALQAVGIVTLPGLDQGDYQIQLSQDQSAVNGCGTPLASAFKDFTVTGPSASLDTLYVRKTISLPDIATGTMLIGVQESGQEPYEVLVEPVSPTDGSTRDSLATRNPLNLKMEVSVKNLFPGDYKITLSDAFGCVKEYFVSLNVDANVFIPNIFTPNGDNVNDVFYIRNGEGARVTITNRWGKEVFKSGNYQNDWGAEGIDDGVYYFQISAAGSTYNGWLEIARGL